MGLLKFLGFGGSKTTVTQTQASDIDIAFSPQIDVALTVEPTPIDLSPLRAIAENFARTSTEGFSRLDRTQRDIAEANVLGLLAIVEGQAAGQAAELVVQREATLLGAMSAEKFRKTLLLIGIGGAVVLVAR